MYNYFFISSIIYFLCQFFLFSLLIMFTLLIVLFAIQILFSSRFCDLSLSCPLNIQAPDEFNYFSLSYILYFLCQFFLFSLLIMLILFVVLFPIQIFFSSLLCDLCLLGFPHVINWALILPLQIKKSINMFSSKTLTNCSTDLQSHSRAVSYFTSSFSQTCGFCQLLYDLNCQRRFKPCVQNLQHQI